MLIIKSPSPSPTSDTRQRGFTLLEITIAAGIGMIVVFMVAKAYMGANKAQSIAYGNSMLKASGQMAIDELYKNLHQNRHLFSRGATADTFLAKLPVSPYNTDPGALTPGLPAPDPTVDLRLPEIKSDGTFNASEAASLTFYPESAGNALLFTTVEPQVTIQDGTPPILAEAFGRSTSFLPTTRLHFYYLARRSLGNGHPVRAGDDYVYQLMHFKSKPYLVYDEVIRWMGAIKDCDSTDDADEDAFIAGKLSAMQTVIAGAMDVGADDAADALYELQPTADHRDLALSATGTRIQEQSLHTPIKLVIRNSYGEAMVAFNTTPYTGTPAKAAVPVPGLDVPAFASDDVSLPFGFEVMVAGPQDARQVLVRLALAMRTMPGFHMTGQTFQQVIHIYEYSDD